MNRPHLSYLDKVRALRGEPHVTFPEGDASYPRTERVVTALRADAVLAFGASEPDATRFPSNVLTYQEEIGGDGIKAEMFRRYEVLPGPLLYSQMQDAETMEPVLITRQRIVTPSLPIAPVAGSDIRFDPQGTYWGYKTIATIEAAGPDDWSNLARTQVEFVNFEFPRLVRGRICEQIALREGSVRTRVGFTSDAGNTIPARAAFTALTQKDTVVTYHSSAGQAAGAAPAIAYAPIFNDLGWTGLFWSTPHQLALNDAVVIPAFTTGTQNPTWGYVAEGTHTFAASTPTATQYLALVAAAVPVVVMVDVQPWKYGLWRLAVQKVVLR